jgi:hypothetical protein
MTTTPGNIFVPGITRVYMGEVGTPAPTSLTVFDAGMIEVGLFTRDSLKFKTEPDTGKIKSAQTSYTTRTTENGIEAMLEVDLQEWSGPNFQRVYGGGLVTETAPASGIWKFTPPAVGGRQEKMTVVQCTDGDKIAVLVIPRTIQTEGVEHDLGNGAESVLPMRLEILGDGTTDPFYWLSNHTAAFAPAAPTASSIVPATGLAAGGYPALITGTDLLGVTGVTFGGVAATLVEAISETKLYVLVPAHAAGAVAVVITDNGGVLTKPAFFTYT